jgi:phospholipid/cholesterol/gamma-HCH transport system ATP-binding protein
MIVVDDVTKFRGHERVLDRVSLSIERGQQVGLIGPGGAGKSLILKIVAGLVRPDSGTVTVDGEVVTSMSEVELASIRGRIGMLFQNYALFDFMTVEENIAFPLRQLGAMPDEEIRAEVKRLLEAVDLPGIQHQFPSELSGGMKKRVTFARAIIANPPILFYDDPTAGLDPVTSGKIFALLESKRRQGGTTSVVISHDLLGMRDICDTFILVDHGRIVFRGSRSDFEASENRFVQQFWRGEADE